MKSENHEGNFRKALDLSQNFFFLIGLLYVNLGKMEFIHYWSENDREQSSVFAKFLEHIRKHQNVPIYHFGSFDAKAIHSIADGAHSNVQDVLERLVNFNSLIYGKIYFPSFGHGLKEIAPIIGARWTATEPSGLQALAWWYKWVETRNTNFKQLLLQYNKEDCLALHSLIQFIAHLTAPNLSVEIDYLDRPRLQSTDRGREVHQTFNDIVKFAHSDYNRNKICFRKTKDTNDIDLILEDTYPVAKRKLPLLKANKIVHAHRRLKCPRCHQRIDHANKKTATALIVDLTFGKQGCRRLVTKYIGPKIHCPNCRKYYNPRAIRDLGKGRRYGTGLAAWIVNQRVVLRMPYSSICQCLLEMYDIHLGTATACEFIKESAKRYANTERKIIELLRLSPFVHVDETQISIEGVNHYVWVFTNGSYVVLKKTETRDATIVLETLKGFKGVLITDFYGGYDSMPWKQQKCLSHFIGDLNEDLWKEPYNKELEDFSSNLRKILLPIFADIEKHGLKTRFLSKHIKKIDRFYKESINQSNYTSETVQKYQKRLKRYRESMFTFLLLDGIPWNNNTAERAIRHLAVQRKISGAFGKITTPFYLRLLGIAQSCRFQNKSFLRFLISKKSDLSLWQDKKTKYCIKIHHRRKKKQKTEDPRAEENGSSKQPPTAPAQN
jgi:uncharacterized CHY-type Zn-finger protein